MLKYFLVQTDQMFETEDFIRDNPFNLRGGGYGFFEVRKFATEIFSSGNLSQDYYFFYKTAC